MFSANFGLASGSLTVLLVTASPPLCCGEAAGPQPARRAVFLKDYVRGGRLRLKSPSQDMQPGPVKSFQGEKKKVGRCQSHTQSWDLSIRASLLIAVENDAAFPAC